MHKLILFLSLVLFVNCFPQPRTWEIQREEHWEKDPSRILEAHRRGELGLLGNWNERDSYETEERIHIPDYLLKTPTPTTPAPAIVTTGNNEDTNSGTGAVVVPAVNPLVLPAGPNENSTVIGSSGATLPVFSNNLSSILAFVIYISVVVTILLLLTLCFGYCQLRSLKQLLPPNGNGKEDLGVKTPEVKPSNGNGNGKKTVTIAPKPEENTPLIGGNEPPTEPAPAPTPTPPSPTLSGEPAAPNPEMSGSVVSINPSDVDETEGPPASAPVPEPPKPTFSYREV